MGYITYASDGSVLIDDIVSKLFRAYGLYNVCLVASDKLLTIVSKLFRAYGLYNYISLSMVRRVTVLFQSSFELMGYITESIEELNREYFPGFKALSSLWVI